jgi:hypothetical protein
MALEELRSRITEVKNNLKGLKVKVDAKAQNAEREARDHLVQVKKHIEQERSKVSAANAEVKNWFEVQKTATAAKIDEWKSTHEANQLNNRAAVAERYAAAAIDIAMAAVDDAEKATVEAWLARQDAKSVQSK